MFFPVVYAGALSDLTLDARDADLLIYRGTGFALRREIPGNTRNLRKVIHASKGPLSWEMYSRTAEARLSPALPRCITGQLNHSR